jgi:hypothetical protein
MRRRAVSALGHFGRSYGSASTKGRWAHEHVIVAERAFGKALPKGAEVHHVDEDKFNNHRSNLVICQDRAYHQLLHQRARIVRAGGNPNTQRVCGRCGLKDIAFFGRSTRDGYQSKCRECLSITRRTA